MRRTWCRLSASPVDGVVLATFQGFHLAACPEHSLSAESPDVKSF